MAARSDAVGQAAGPEGQLAAEAAHRGAVDLERRVGRGDLFVLGDGGVKPRQARLASEVVVAVVVGHLVEYRQAELDLAGRRVGRPHGGAARVEAGRGIRRDGDATPQGADRPLCHAHILGQRLASPVRASQRHTTEPVGGDGFPTLVTQIGEVDREMLEPLARREQADLEDVELVPLGGPLEHARRASLHPTQGQVVVHPDRVLAVLGEDQVPIIGVRGDDLCDFGLGGHDLHGVEPAELSPGVDRGDLSPR